MAAAMRGSGTARAARTTRGNATRGTVSGRKPARTYRDVRDPAVPPTITKLVPQGQGETSFFRANRGASRGDGGSPDSIYARTQRSNRQTGGQTGGIAKMAGDSGPVITGLFLLGVVLIWLDILVSKDSSGEALDVSNYEDKLISGIVRTTGFMGIFLLLSLMSSGSQYGGSSGAAKFAKYFAILVDLGLIFNIAKNDFFTNIGDIIKGGTTSPQQEPQAEAPQDIIQSGGPSSPDTIVQQVSKRADSSSSAKQRSGNGTGPGQVGGRL